MLLLWVLCFRKIQIFISKNKAFYFANYRFPIRFVMFRFENYSRPPLRKNQEEKKKQQLSDNMKTTEARLHADDGQELWNVKEGIRLSIQQRLVVFSRSLFASLLHYIKGTVLPFFFPLPPSLNWYPPSHKLLFSLPHWISRKFRLFSLARHFIFFTDESNFPLNLVLAT